MLIKKKRKRIAMQRIMQRIIESLKQYWDILGGTLLGVIITVIFKWQIEKIQIAYSLIILILVFIGFLKVVFNDYEKNKKDKEGNEDVLHKIVDSQISMKAIKISQNPMQEGETLGQLVLRSTKGKKNKMKKIKNFFKWIVKYKEQLIGLCGSIVYAGFTIYAYIYDNFDFILKYFPDTRGWEIGVKIGVGVISVLFIVFGIRNQCKWVGVGSLQTAKNYLEQLGNKVGSKLSPEARRVVQNALRTLENTLKQSKIKYNKVLVSFEAKKLEIKPVQELISLGIGDITKLNQQLAQLQQEANNFENELKSIDKDIENLQEQINQYQHALSS